MSAQAPAQKTPSRFAQWRKARRLERQSRTVASRQMRGSQLFIRYAVLVVVAILLVGPLVLGRRPDQAYPVAEAEALDLGGSAAQSVVLMIMVVALTIFQFRFIEKRVQYQ